MPRPSSQAMPPPPLRARRPPAVWLRRGERLGARRCEPDWWSIRAADDGLVPLDDRTGDDAAADGEQEDGEVGDLVDLAELAHRHGCRGLRPPVVVRPVELALGGVLAFRVGPPDVAHDGL